MRALVHRRSLAVLPRSLTTLPPSRRLPSAPVARSFHSPFAALNKVGEPAGTSRGSAYSPGTQTPYISNAYEKQLDDPTSEPLVSSSGTRTYVVSEPDPALSHSGVPYGAYPASASYASTGTNPANPMQSRAYVAPSSPEGNHGSITSASQRLKMAGNNGGGGTDPAWDDKK